MSKPPVWVHACSAGEVQTMRPLLESLQKEHPDIPLLLSASTQAGLDLARKSTAEAAVWCPADTPGAVRTFFEIVKPRALVLAETELWPNLIFEAKWRGVPVAVVNGRISDKHLSRYRRFRHAFAELLPALNAIGVQNEEYAERFAALGANRDTIHITGNLKFDAVCDSVPPRQRARLRAELGIPAGAPVLLFGSTRPGDEALAASCWRVLREACPGLFLIVAPRHPQRAGEVMAEFSEPMRRRSQPQEGPWSPLFLLDTTGELIQFYSIADVAVVGGSFYPGVNGHNPLEPAALGVPTVFGAYMRNFADPAKVLLDSGGALRVAEPESLGASLLALLEDAGIRRSLGTLGRKAVLEHRGAVRQNVAMIEAMLGLKPAANNPFVEANAKE